MSRKFPVSPPAVASSIANGALQFIHAALRIENYLVRDAADNEDLSSDLAVVAAIARRRMIAVGHDQATIKDFEETCLETYGLQVPVE